MSLLVLPRPRSLLVSLVLMLLAAAFAVVVVKIVTTMRHVQQVKATVPPISAVVWGNRVFSDETTLAVWLRARGAEYPLWANRHPHAHRLLKSAKTR